MQYSFGIIKPDAMKKKFYGKILDDIANAGFKLIGLKLFHLTEEKAKNFYAMHADKPFFNVYLIQNSEPTRTPRISVVGISEFQ